MSPKGSPNTNRSGGKKKASKAPESLAQDLDDQALNTRSLTRMAELLDSNSPSSGKLLDYRGTMTRPLSYYGDFDVKPETTELPWVSDNVSGMVHPDMHTISMLYNDDLTLPKAAENFIEQSSALKEEARWERLKAAFYGFYPENLKGQAFEALNGMSHRDASRIIAMKTSRYENEIVLRPKPNNSESWANSDSDNEPETETETETESQVDAESCSEEDAEILNQELQKICHEYEEIATRVSEDFQSVRHKLSKRGSFMATKDTHAASFENSLSWAQMIKEYQAVIRKCVETRILLHHLSHAVARYDPRTGWIHVKTQLWRRGQEEKSVPKGISEVTIHSKYKIKGSPEAQDSAVDNQMELFENELRTFTSGHFGSFDFYHNVSSFHEYEVRIPYANVDPAMCEDILRVLLPQDDWDPSQIVSKPLVASEEKSHHLLKVYVNSQNGNAPAGSRITFNATAEYKNRDGYCRNCFSKEHSRNRCDKPVYAFARPIKAQDGG